MSLAANGAGTPNSVEEDELVELSPKVIEWAIHRANIPYSKIEKKVRIGRNELLQPLPFDKAKALADVLHIPFGFLFLDSPPKINIPLPDFHTRNNEEIRKPSLNLSQLLNDVQLQQDWYRNHRLQSDVAQLDFVGSFTYSSEIREVATAISRRLLITSFVVRLGRGIST